MGAEESRSVDGCISRVWGFTALPTDDFTGAATSVSVLSILLNVCPAGDHSLWVVARSTLDRMATAALPSFSPRRVGHGPVVALSCLPHMARATNQEVL